jgi:hypothetical protein
VSLSLENNNSSFSSQKSLFVPNVLLGQFCFGMKNCPICSSFLLNSHNQYAIPSHGHFAMTIFTIAYEALWMATETDRSKTDDVIFILNILPFFFFPA